MANRVGIPIAGLRSDIDDPAAAARPRPNETLAAALRPINAPYLTH